MLTTLAREYAVFNRWFSSIPGPTLCNRAFAHYGTSFGHVGMELFYSNTKYKSIYERLIDAKHTSKMYYFDQASSSLEVINLLKNQPKLFGTYDQFLEDCGAARCRSTGSSSRTTAITTALSGEIIASDQHPDHHVSEGERFIASIYKAIRKNPALWETTALLISL